MKDEREYIPVKNKMGLFEKNPNFTGCKFTVFQEYEVKLLKDFPEENYKMGKRVKVIKFPNEILFLLNNSGQIFHTDAKEGVDFKLVK